jgi:phosphatidylinositol 4-kinase
LEIVSSSLFTEYLGQLADASEASKLVQYLMIQYCQSLKAVRKAAKTYLIEVSKRAPAVLWDSACIQTLLSLVQTVSKACDDNYSEALVYSRPDLGASVNFSESMADRRELLEKLSGLATKWLGSAASLAPDATQHVIQNFMVQFSSSMNGPDGSNKDYSRAVSALDVRPIVGKSSATTSSAVTAKNSRTSHLKSFFSGQALWIKSGALSGSRHLEAISEPREFVEEAYRWTALAVNGHDGVGVMNSIVRGCFAISKPDVTEVCVDCWTWFISCHPEKEVDLLSAIASAFTDSADHCRGVFGSDGLSREQSALSQELVIDFLRERMLITGEQNLELSSLFFSLASSLVEDCRRVLHSPVARRVIFKIVSFALRVSHLRHLGHHLAFLRRVIRFALRWFGHSPVWGYGSSLREAQDECNILLEVCHQLDVERSFLKKHGHETANVLFTVPRITSIQLQVDDAGSTWSGKSRRTANPDGQSRMSTSVHDDSGSNGFLSRNQSAGQEEVVFLVQHISLLMMLLGHELDRLDLWFNPMSTSSLKVVIANPYDWFRTMPKTELLWYLHIAWTVDPSIAAQMYVRFRSAVVRQELQNLVRIFDVSVCEFPQLVPFVVNKRSVSDNDVQLRLLSKWATCDFATTMSFLLPELFQHPAVRSYVLKGLFAASVEDVSFFLPQIIQAMRYDDTGEIFFVLQNVAKRDARFCHRLLWALRTELRDQSLFFVDMTDALKQPEAHGVLSSPSSADSFFLEKCRNLFDELIRSFSAVDDAFFRTEFEFFDKLLSFSGKLRRFEKPVRRKALLDFVSPVVVPRNVYLPSNPDFRIVGIKKDKCLPMQSAAKSPVLIPFEVVSENVFGTVGSDPHVKGRDKTPLDVKSCILKMGDDCRQDQLALQVIALFKRIFDSCELPLYLFPYRVFTVAHECGIIECVPNTMSRDQLGHRVEGSLFDYFLQRYGHKDSVAFQRARRNFVRSMAAYSVVSYILNIKDRHNGNILVSDEGHIIHIDFGFIYDISPGGDFGFESSPFKLTTEMLAVMGMGVEEKKRRVNSESFDEFVSLVVKGFLACREHVDLFLSLTALMLPSALPCFKPDTMRNLESRFAPELSERDAAAFMMAKVEESYENLRTVMYDQFQRIAEGIQC